MSDLQGCESITLIAFIITMTAKNADFDAILATHRTVFDQFCLQKTLIILCLYKVLVILVGFGGLVKRKQKITQAIVRGLD